MKELFTQPLDPRYRQESTDSRQAVPVGNSFAPGLMREMAKFSGQSQSTGREMVVYRDPPQKNEGEFVGAVLKVGAAYWLNSKMNAETKQQELLDTVQDKLNIKRRRRGGGEPVRTSFPIFGKIGSVLDAINGEYEHLAIHNKLLTKEDIDIQVEKNAEIITRDVFRGDFDNEGETTEAERELAKDILSDLGRRPPNEIREKVYYAVHDRAMDRAEITTARTLHNEYSGFLSNFDRLQRRSRSDLYFVPDYVSTELMMDGEEREDLKNSAFALTPKGILIERVSHTGEDTIDIPWEYLSKQAVEKYNWAVWPGVLRNPDIIRSGLGFFRPFLPQVTEFAKSEHLAGALSFQNLGRNVRYNIAVKQADQLKNRFNNLGGLVDSIRTFRDHIMEQKNKKTGNHPPHLRPGHILPLLPPGTDIIPYEREIDGSLNFPRAKSRLQLMKDRIQAAINETAIRAASNLDADGNPPEIYQQRIDELRRREEKLGQDIERFGDYGA